MKKFLLKLLLNKKQREIIWQAIIFSEYTYRRRGNVDCAAVVQTVINEIQSLFGFTKKNYSKEEVDYIVANISNNAREYFEKRIKDAFRSGVYSCKDELETAYKKGVADTIDKIATLAIDEQEKREDNEKDDNTVEDSNESSQQEQVSSIKQE
jgi:N-methylhydantoinase B/oxoprolinase/acetone carboxylase alpha subunit